jgi:hypothetical protein
MMSGYDMVTDLGDDKLQYKGGKPIIEMISGPHDLVTTYTNPVIHPHTKEFLWHYDTNIDTPPNAEVESPPPPDKVSL